MADAKGVPVKTDPFPLDQELQSGSEFRDLLLDILNKQDISDIQVTERDCDDGYSRGADAKQPADTLTLYATNDEESAEPSRAIQIDSDQVNRIYSTYFNTKEVDETSSISCLDNKKEPNQIEVKTCYSPFIPQKAVEDSSLIKASSAQVEGGDISLNSSGYTSANSPVVSNDPSYTTSPPESINVVRTVTPDPLSIHSPELSNILARDEVPLINQSTHSKEANTSDVNLISRVATDQDNVSSQVNVINFSVVNFPNPTLNPSPVPSDSNSKTIENPYNVPTWLSQLYPELHQAWENNSGSEYYQGGVQLHCSVCSNPSSGFYDNLPLCETHRVGKACTVCRLRLAAGFSYGLALCEADRIFLYKLFVKPPRLQRCPTLCPVTVQQWCPYCRLRTCLATKGFRFTTVDTMKPDSKHKVIPVSNARKRKYSGSTTDVSQSASQINAFDFPTTTFPSSIAAESSTKSDPMVHQAEKMPTWARMSNLTQPPKFVQPSFKLMPGLSKVASFQAENPPFRESPQLDSTLFEQQVQANPGMFRVDPDSSLPLQQGRVAQINQQQLLGASQIIGCSSTMQPSTVPFPTTQIMHPTQVQANHGRPHHGGQRAPVMTASYFNGASLGSSKKSLGKREGVLTDRINHSWVKEQQEKYLRYHMKLYQLRKK